MRPFLMYLPATMQSEQRWLKLMDGNDVLRVAWAARVVGHVDEPLMYLLEERAASQVGLALCPGIEPCGPFSASDVYAGATQFYMLGVH